MGEITQDPNEGILKGVVWYTRDEVDNLITTGQIFCGFTQAGLAMYDAHVRSQAAAQVVAETQ